MSTTPAPTVWPSLRYRDAPAALDFLSRAFGFEVRADYRDPDDPSLVTHAELSWPLGGGVMLGSDRPSPSWPAHAGMGAVYVVTDEPDSLHQRAVAAGAGVLREPADTDYGSREFAVTDPEGNLWSFGTYEP
jgi:uncharacterized glyoxalase superfamily protein PhnB